MDRIVPTCFSVQAEGPSGVRWVSWHCLAKAPLIYGTLKIRPVDVNFRNVFHPYERQSRQNGLQENTEVERVPAHERRIVLGNFETDSTRQNVTKAALVRHLLCGTIAGNPHPFDNQAIVCKALDDGRDNCIRSTCPNEEVAPHLLETMLNVMKRFREKLDSVWAAAPEGANS